MRALVIALAVGLIGALLAFLVRPTVINQPRVQTELRRLVENATGADLVVGGRIGVDLLPVPTLNLLRVTSGGDRLRPQLAVDRMDLVIDPLALLTGRLAVRRVILIRPRLAAAVPAPDAGFSALGDVLGTDRFRHLVGASVVDGRIDLLGTSTQALDHVHDVDAELRREPDSGRISVTATALTATDEPVEIDGEVAEPTNAAPTAVRLALARGPDRDVGRIDFRGFASLRPGGSGPAREAGHVSEAAVELRGEIGVDAASTAALSRTLEPFGLAADLPPLPELAPIALNGRLTLDQGRLQLAELDLRLRAARLGGDLSIDLGAIPRLDARLTAGEIALGPAPFARLAAVLGRVRGPEALLGRVRLDVDALRTRDQTIRQAHLDLGLDGSGAIDIASASARLPGNGLVSLKGRFEPGRGDPRLEGRLEVSADDVAGVLPILGATGVPGLVLPRTLEGGAAVRVDANGATVSDAELRLGGTRMAGSARYRSGPAPVLAISARADQLSLIDRPDPTALRRLRALLAGPEGVRIDVDLALERGLVGLVRLGRGRLRASLDKGVLSLRELALDDVEEARLRLGGSVDLRGSDFDLAGEVGTPRPTPILRAFLPQAPATVARFGPTLISAALHGSAERTRVDLTLNAAGIHAAITGSTGPALDLSSADLRLDAAIGALWAGLRNVGLAGAAFGGPVGATRIEAQIRRVGDSWTVTGGGPLPGGELDLALGLTSIGAGPRLDGNITLPRLDPALAQALSDLGRGWATRLGAEAWTGPLAYLGRLPTRDVAWDRLFAGSGDLSLATGTVAGTRLMLHGRLDEGHLVVDQLDVPLAGGRLGGVLTLDARGPSGLLGARLELTRARAERLAAMLGFGQGVSGDADVFLQLAGGGRSVAELADDLDGNGHLALDQGRMTVDGRTIDVQDLAGPIVVERGIVTAPPPGLALTYEGGTGHVPLRFDLATWIAEIGLGALPSPPAAAEPAQRLIGAPGRLQEIVPAPAP